MYRFSYVPSVSGTAVEVSKELFLQIIQDTKVKSVCAQIAQASAPEEISRLKRQLPAFCWHAWFEQGKRKNYAAHASGLIMLDLDHVGDARATYDSLAEKAQALGLLVAHITPSTQGLRLVFPVPEGLDLIEAQTYYKKMLRLKNVDACTKDLARLSFCVPEDYFLYIDEASLFDGPAVAIEASRSDESCTNVNSRTASGGAASLRMAPSEQEGCPQGGEVSPMRASLEEESRGNDGFSGTKSQPCQSFDECVAYPECYDSIPYSLLVSALQEQLGGIPAHGSRNNFIYSMAAHLRYLCNDDPDWIASILPTYGEAADRWRRTIDSACQRSQYKVMPQLVQRAIEIARSKVAALSEPASDDAPPAMPKRLPKLIKHLTKNVPDVCKAAVANAVFPALAAHLNGVKFWLIDGTEKEATFMCVTMAKQSSGKSAVNKPIEYIVADIVERDEINRKREQEWKDASANKASNKEKPQRPDDLCVQVLVSDMTNAAFVQRMKDAGGRYLYTNLEELDLLKQLQTNGTKDVGKIICLCFDNGKYGQERVGTQSVTARVDLRWNWNAASTVQKGIAFFKNRLVDGTLSRLNFATILPDDSKPFEYGRYDDRYAEELKPYITNLNLATGHIECPQALALARTLSARCAEEGALSSDEVYKDLSYRAVTIAYLKAMVLYIANGMAWSKDIADFATWSLQYDLWCKMRFFGEQVRQETAKEQVKKPRGRQNLLNLLPDTFSLLDAQQVRSLQGLDEAGTRQMVSVWTHRGYVQLDSLTGNYVKTQQFRNRGRD